MMYASVPFLCRLRFPSGWRQPAGSLGPPGTADGFRACSQGHAEQHQPGELQQLRPQDGHQPWSHHVRGHRSTQAPFRHLGQHSQRGQPHGKHGQGREHSGGEGDGGHPGGVWLQPGAEGPGVRQGQGHAHDLLPPGQAGQRAHQPTGRRR
ncbi:unnamed protein product, partial [Ixodes pacificus]